MNNNIIIIHIMTDFDGVFFSGVYGTKQSRNRPIYKKKRILEKKRGMKERRLWILR